MSDWHTETVSIFVPEIMDVRQCSEYLGISADSLYLYAKQRRLPAFKLGNRWRFKKSLVDAWMVKQCEQAEKDYLEGDNGRGLSGTER